jgi:hydrogenase expression/formation protein HypC
VCLAIPGEILRIEGEEPLGRMGLVRFGGITKQVSLTCVPDAKIGQYVLVHVGLAISVIDEAEAARVFEYLAQMNELAELAPESS